MSLAEELMELQGLANNDMGETRIGGKSGEYEDGAMDFDDQKNTNAIDEFPQYGERTPPYKDPSKVFMESGIRRGMRQFNQQLIRSGGNTDLASYEEVVLVQTGDRSGGQTGSSQQEIVQIDRSVGTTHRNWLLKGVGEIDDEDFNEDGEASGNSSKQLILGSESDMPFGRHLDESFSGQRSPVSASLTKDKMQQYLLEQKSRNKSGQKSKLKQHVTTVTKEKTRFSVNVDDDSPEQEQITVEQPFNIIQENEVSETALKIIGRKSHLLARSAPLELIDKDSEENEEADKLDHNDTSMNQ